jgi:hypothetical protein
MGILLEKCAALRRAAWFPRMNRPIHRKHSQPKRVAPQRCKRDVDSMNRRLRAAPRPFEAPATWLPPGATILDLPGRQGRSGFVRWAFSFLLRGRRTMERRRRPVSTVLIRRAVGPQLAWRENRKRPGVTSGQGRVVFSEERVAGSPSRRKAGAAACFTPGRRVAPVCEKRPSPTTTCGKQGVERCPPWILFVRGRVKSTGAA